MLIATTSQDKKTLDAILAFIGSNTEIEDQIAKNTRLSTNLNPEQFSNWLMNVQTELILNEHYNF